MIKVILLELTLNSFMVKVLKDSMKPISEEILTKKIDAPILEEEVDWMELKRILDHVFSEGERVSLSDRSDSYWRISHMIEPQSVIKFSIFSFTDTNGNGFSKDICRSMLAMLDTDHSGKLSLNELKMLLNDITYWQVKLDEELTVITVITKMFSRPFSNSLTRTTRKISKVLTFETLWRSPAIS